jgi:hypothetical protein
MVDPQLHMIVTRLGLGDRVWDHGDKYSYNCGDDWPAVLQLPGWLGNAKSAVLAPTSQRETNKADVQFMRTLLQNFGTLDGPSPLPLMHLEGRRRGRKSFEVVSIGREYHKHHCEVSNINPDMV